MISINTQSSIRIEKDKVYYFDPFKIDIAKKDADYIFITHDHYDHFDEKSILNVIKDDTLLIVPKYLESEVKKYTNNILLVEPGNDYENDSIKFKTCYSYNIDKNYHPKEKGNVGYLINIDNVFYYIMGDTDSLEENLNIKCDICFIPIGGTFTMDYNEASDFVNNIKPKKVIPIHYGSIVGDISLGDKFKDNIDKDIEVELYIRKG